MDFTPEEIGEIEFAVRQQRNRCMRELAKDDLHPEYVDKNRARLGRCLDILRKLRAARPERILQQEETRHSVTPRMKGRSYDAADG